MHATNDPGVIMHASSASGAGHWISALIFFAFDIGTPFFHSPTETGLPRQGKCPAARIIAQGMRCIYARISSELTLHTTRMNY